MALARSLRLPEMILPQHNLTRYVRVRLSVDDGVMVWRRPRLILGVIPVGRSELRVPVRAIESMKLQAWTPRPLRWPFAAGLVAGAIAFTPWWAMAPLILLGAWVGFVSIGPSLGVVTSDGRTHRAAVCFGHRIDAELFIDAVAEMSTEARETNA